MEGSAFVHLQAVRNRCIKKERLFNNIFFMSNVERELKLVCSSQYCSIF